VTATSLDLQRVDNGWSEKGGTGPCSGATTSYSCTGNLESESDRVVLVATPNAKATGYEVTVQAVPGFEVRGAKGGSVCGDDNGDTALQPAAGDKYMPTMLTAKLAVSLNALRALKPGKSLDIKVTSGDNSPEGALPPNDCLRPGRASCKQKLTWKGDVTFVRRK
jgi:hypothetical protein